MTAYPEKWPAPKPDLRGIFKNREPPLRPDSRLMIQLSRGVS